MIWLDLARILTIALGAVMERLLRLFQPRDNRPRVFE